ncbi:MAG: hypothetical protein ACMUIU_00175 [bacterium]
MIKINRFLYIISFLLIALIIGCAPRTWVRLDQIYMNGPDNTYSVNLPFGWVHAEFVKDKLLITRDGPGIQIILIEKYSHQNAFPAIGKRSSEDMLPSELAELTISEMKATSDMSNIVVLENKPTTIGGRPGFRIHAQFKNERGLRYELILYGFTNKIGFYTLYYRAPSLHYFPRDIEVFENIVKSFTLN